MIASVALTIISIAVSCDKPSHEGNSSQANQLKFEDYPSIPTPCHFWYDCHMDSCMEHFVPDCAQGYVNYYVEGLCGISYDCLDSLIIDIGDLKGRKCYIGIPNYREKGEFICSVYETFMQNGEISFSCDFPASDPRLNGILPNGYVPAGTYPFFKRGNDAMIDISCLLE